jgi:hypothetical protein
MLFDLLGVAETVEHNVGALFGHCTRNAQADARGGTGNQCCLAA